MLFTLCAVGYCLMLLWKLSRHVLRYHHLFMRLPDLMTGTPVVVVLNKIDYFTSELAEMKVVSVPEALLNE